MAKLNSIIICEEAVLSKETNNLSLINTFDSIRATGFPARHPKFVVVASVIADEGSHTERMVIKKGDTEIISAQNNFTGKSHRWISHFLGTLFPEEGLYEIAYYLDGIFLGSAPLTLNKQ